MQAVFEAPAAKAKTFAPFLAYCGEFGSFYALRALFAGGKSRFLARLAVLLPIGYMVVKYFTGWGGLPGLLWLIAGQF